MCALEAGMWPESLETIDVCAASRATIIPLQLPIDHWQGWIDDATIADAILDRVMQRAQRINVGGNSMRRPPRKKPKTEGD